MLHLYRADRQRRLGSRVDSETSSSFLLGEFSGRVGKKSQEATQGGEGDAGWRVLWSLSHGRWLFGGKGGCSTYWRCRLRVPWNVLYVVRSRWRSRLGASHALCAGRAAYWQKGVIHR